MQDTTEFKSAVARLMRDGDPSSAKNQKLVMAAHIVANDLIGKLKAAAEKRGPLSPGREVYILLHDWVLARTKSGTFYLVGDGPDRSEYWLGGEEPKFNEENLDDAIWFSRYLVKNGGYEAWSRKCVEGFLDFSTNWEVY